MVSTRCNVKSAFRTRVRFPTSPPIKESSMNRIWTHIVVDEDNYEIRKFLSLREARHFAERNNLTVVATGEKAVTQRDLYKQALLECGEALF